MADQQQQQPVAPHAISSHPAPADAAATSSGVQTDATKQPSGTTTNTSNSGGVGNDTAAARHAMEHAQSWKPSLDRRQSWNKEDQKRALQMTGMEDAKSSGGGGGVGGFTEGR